MKSPKQNANNTPAIHSLQQLVENTCFCKLKASCPDKNSQECMRHRNIYAEAMLQKTTTS